MAYQTLLNQVPNHLIGNNKKVNLIVFLNILLSLMLRKKREYSGKCKNFVFLLSRSRRFGKIKT